MRAVAAMLVLAGACGSAPVVAGDQRLLIAPPLAACDAGAAVLARLRVVTWNIEGARGSSVADVAAVLAGLDADVMLLQEVDVGVARSGGANQAEALATALQADYAFAEALPWEGGHYGLATLSHLRFRSVDRISLDAVDASEPRIGLDATLCFGPTALRLVDTHADVNADAAAVNAMQLAGALAAAVGSGLLVAGDFNGVPGDPGPRAMVAAGLTDVVAPLDPSPTAAADRRIDFVFADARVAPTVTAARVVPSDKSDHRPVVADFAPLF